MAVSQTTFDQRLTRISKGQTVDAAALVGRAKTGRSIRSRCMTFPFFVGIGILTGVPGYAFASTQPDLSWVIAEVQRVIGMIA